MTIDGLTVLVASLDDVIASKEAAGRDKDFEALPGLIRLRHCFEAGVYITDIRARFNIAERDSLRQVGLD